MPDNVGSPILEARAVSLGYGRTPVVSALNIVVPTAALTVLLGPNGCGKSTLLKGLAGTLNVQSGSVVLDGRAVASLPSKEVARRVGLLPQGQSVPDGLTVVDLVRQGRYPHRTLFGSFTKEDEAACAQALALTGTEELAHRRLDTLSGGQRQRAWIAMTLAQQTDILLLDEPTTYLDLAHQIEIMNLLRRLVVQHGVTAVAVLHDINQAARYADHIVLMKNGAIVSAGGVSEVMTTTALKVVFDVDVTIFTDPHSGKPICIPMADDAVKASPRL